MRSPVADRRELDFRRCGRHVKQAKGHPSRLGAAMYGVLSASLPATTCYHNTENSMCEDWALIKEHRREGLVNFLLTRWIT